MGLGTSKKTGIFVSGTDTNVGKTLVSSLILSSLIRSGFKGRYFKPIQTGHELDTDRVSELTGVPVVEFPRPSYYFSKPAAPFWAAWEEGQMIELERVVRDWDSQEEGTWVVEGAGGLMVPVASGLTIRDLIYKLDLPMLLVASTKLGTMNHTLLTVECARRAGIRITGIILMGDSEPQLNQILEEFTGIKVLVQIPFFSPVSPVQVQKMSEEFISIQILEAIYESIQ